MRAKYAYTQWLEGTQAGSQYRVSVRHKQWNAGGGQSTMVIPGLVQINNRYRACPLSLAHSMLTCVLVLD